MSNDRRRQQLRRIDPDRRRVDEEEAGIRHVDQTLISWLIIVALWLGLAFRVSIDMGAGGTRRCCISRSRSRSRRWALPCGGGRDDRTLEASRWRHSTAVVRAPEEIAAGK